MEEKPKTVDSVPLNSDARLIPICIRSLVLAFFFFLFFFASYHYFIFGGPAIQGLYGPI